MQRETAKLAKIVMLSQVSWFACVLGAAAQHPWIGPTVVAGTLAFNMVVSRQPLDVLKLALFGAFLGLTVEMLLIATGFVSYAAPGYPPNLPPFWLIAMWVAFSTLPNTAFVYLHGRIMLQTLFGLIGAPLAYFAGERLGAMWFAGPPILALIAIGLSWAVAFPTLMFAAQRIDARAKAKPRVSSEN